MAIITIPVWTVSTPRLTNLNSIRRMVAIIMLIIKISNMVRMGHHA